MIFFDSVNAESSYQPLKVYPCFVGSLNVTVVPTVYVPGLSLLFVPPFKLYVIVYAFSL